MLVVEGYVQDGIIPKEKAATIDTPSQKVSSAGTDEKRSLATAKEHHDTMLELADLLEAPSTQRDGSSS